MDNKRESAMKEENLKPKISVIVPVFNEEKNVASLHNEIVNMLKRLGGLSEVIFVDDSSTDNTVKVLNELKPVTIIKLRKNSGQSAALDAGIKHASGSIIVTLDGDGQNDPADIPALLNKLKEGYDVVCGWRHKRRDSFPKRVISRGAAVLRRFLVDDNVQDAGCTLRVYKKECFEDLDLYGELHRMIPALLKWRGFKVGELKVNHRQRKFEKSKYTFMRIPKGFLDMLYVWFWRKYAYRPLHLFGGMGLFFIFFGICVLALMFYLKVFYAYTLSDKIWPMVGFFSLIIGLQFLLSGILAAHSVESGGGRKYYIERKIVKE